MFLIQGGKASFGIASVGISNSFFVLSRFPYQSCFFCGAAGPETVIEVYSESSNIKIDKKVIVRGVFKLNESDPVQLFFMLKDAEIIKP